MNTQSSAQSKRPSVSEQINAQVKKDAMEKKKESSVWLTRLIVVMACIYFADVLMLDILLYAVVGFFATLLEGVFANSVTWVATVKASLGSIKPVTFLGATFGAVFLAKMRS